ncbi:MAG: SIMPL domain-containing protein [Dehalococcoidales bacterium]|nr:SIMPL domain-containing protein [Dehalococcoidales bacterium]
MRKLSLVFAALLLISLIAGSTGCDIYGDSGDDTVVQSINSDQNIGISVTGVGEVDVNPDIALVNIGVQVQMKTLAEAQQQAAESMAAVTDVLKNNSIADKDIQTAAYSIQPVWAWVDSNYVFIGYKVTNIVNVKIREMDAIGDIIDESVVAGGEYVIINSIAFTIDKPETYYESIRSTAMDDAKAKATQLAKSAGVKVGKPISINESAYYSINKSGAQAVDIEGRVPTSISAGELTISITVQVVYTIG